MEKFKTKQTCTIFRQVKNVMRIYAVFCAVNGVCLKEIMKQDQEKGWLLGRAEIQIWRAGDDVTDDSAK